MLYYTEAARQNAIDRIKKHMVTVAEIPGDHLSYTDAHEIGIYLSRLIEAIEAESKQYAPKTRHTEVRWLVEYHESVGGWRTWERNIATKEEAEKVRRYAYRCGYSARKRCYEITVED